MPKASIIKVLSREVKLPIYRIEQLADINQGTLSKAIKEDRELTPGLIWKLSNWRPEIKEWLATGDLSLINNSVKESALGSEIKVPLNQGQDQQSEVPRLSDHREKYIALLEKNLEDAHRNKNELDELKKLLTDMNRATSKTLLSLSGELDDMWYKSEALRRLLQDFFVEMSERSLPEIEDKYSTYYYEAQAGPSIEDNSEPGS